MTKQQNYNGQRAMEYGAMSTRRQFVQVASAIAVSSFLPRAFASPLFSDPQGFVFNPHLLPSIDQIWESLSAMNQLGPRYTGNDAHRRYVDMLESDMREAGLQTARDSYTFPRWEARKWALQVATAGGAKTDIPITFYYPHSGQTGPDGVTGMLTYVGKIISDGSGKPDLSVDLKGKIAVVDYELAARDYNEWYQPWGFYTPDTKLDKYITSTIAVEMGLLTEYKKAGAVGVIVVWSNLSDGQAEGQNMPFGRPLQDIPALFVNHESGAKLRQLASEHATVTLKLEADVFANAQTDSLIATLPGSSPKEAIIIATHTDGPNAVQENAGVGLVALARYFSKIPQNSRNRTIIFALTTGHDNSAYVPNIQGFIDKHPDLIQRAVCSMTVEHLGCREWRDDAVLQYKATGEDELTYAITRHQPLADAILQSAPGTAEHRVAAVKPTSKGRYLGVGGALANTGMPTLGYYASPTYLNIVASDGCMSKLSRPLMYGQITELAKLVHKLDIIPASDLGWLPPTPRRPGAASG